MLYGIVGNAGDGKDTVSDILVANGVVARKYALAFPVKTCVHALFGWSDEAGEDPAKRTMLPVTLDVTAFRDAVERVGLSRHPRLHHPPFQDPLRILYVAELCRVMAREQTHPSDNPIALIEAIPRRAYQVFGTDIGRNLIDKSLWLDLAPMTDVVISDVRMVNEAQWVKANDGILVRPVGRKTGRKPSDATQHESEREIKEIERLGLVDIHLDNTGSKDNLRLQVEQRLLVCH